MKNTLLALPILLGLSISAQAGETYSAKSAKAVVPPPVNDCRLQWFTAASVGYLTDQEEAMFHLQFGVEKICPDYSNALYLEVGYTEYDESYTPPISSTFIPSADLDMEIIPITLNYKHERPLTQNINWYVGVGAGIALVDLDVDQGNGTQSYDDTVFYAQAFAGIVYNVSEAFEVFTGVRYIYMEDPDLSDVGAYDDRASIDGDILVELGARYNF